MLQKGNDGRGLTEGEGILNKNGRPAEMDPVKKISGVMDGLVAEVKNDKADLERKAAVEAAEMVVDPDFKKAFKDVLRRVLEDEGGDTTIPIAQIDDGDVFITTDDRGARKFTLKGRAKIWKETLEEAFDGKELRIEILVEEVSGAVWLKLKVAPKKQQVMREPGIEPTVGGADSRHFENECGAFVGSTRGSEEKTPWLGDTLNRC